MMASCIKGHHDGELYQRSFSMQYVRFAVLRTIFCDDYAVATTKKPARGQPRGRWTLCGEAAEVSRNHFLIFSGEGQGSFSPR